MGLLERPQVDRHSLLEWSLYRNVDALTPETLVEDVRSVLPGHVVRISNGAISSKQYYSQIAHVSEERYRHHQAARLEDVIDDMDAILNEAVKLRLVSDVPVGTLLSGGLDFSLVTSIAAKYTRDLTAFHVSVEGFPNLDERRHAETLTKRFGLPLVPFSLTGEIFRRELPRVVYFSDLPLTHPNSVAYYLISKVAREHGVIVLLSGEGADELFGGYSWNYRRKRMLLRLQPWLRLVPAKLHDWLALLVYSHAGMPVGSLRFRERLPPAVDLIDRYARLDWAERCAEAYSFVADARDRAVLGSMLADLSDFLAPLLRRLDRTSMGASVECRVPFLDHRLVHRAINLPLDYKVGRHADKWILKQVATRYFSGQLVTRKKMGFPIAARAVSGAARRPRVLQGRFLRAHTRAQPSRPGASGGILAALGAGVLRPADARDLGTPVLLGAVDRGGRRAAAALRRQPSNGDPIVFSPTGATRTAWVQSLVATGSKGAFGCD